MPMKRVIYALAALVALCCACSNEEEVLPQQREKLVSCYRTSLELAREKGCASVAFPLISAGVYGYPKEQALAVAVDTISAFLQQHDMQVTLVLFDRAVVQIAEEKYPELWKQ